MFIQIDKLSAFAGLVDGETGASESVQSFWLKTPKFIRLVLFAAAVGLAFWFAWNLFEPPPNRSVGRLGQRKEFRVLDDEFASIDAKITTATQNIPETVFDPSQHPNLRLKSLSIEDIRVGMRVPALNPAGVGGGVSELDLMARACGVPISQLRTFTLHVAVADGSVQEIQLVRPASWVARNVILAAAITEELEYEAAVEFQNEQPWTALGLNAWNELTADPVERIAALAGDGFESARWGMPLVSASPTSLLTTAISRIQSGLTESFLEQVETDELVARLEREILDGQAIGVELYVELEELGVEGWATLEGVEPARSQDVVAEQIDPDSHRLLRLVANRADGSRTDITLIRSVDWIRENLGEAALGWAQSDSPAKLRLDIPELRLSDYADVIAIEPCPPIKSGPGEVVTATYHTDRAKVIDLRFDSSSEPFGTTAEHPFWSVSRQAFVPAGKLEIGEQVVTISGETTRLSDISPRDGPESVYNFEVAGQHTYFVSRDGVLVHNAGKGVYLGNLLGPGNSKLAKNGAKSPVTRQAKKAVHGNTLNSAPAALYARYDASGNFVKWGITKHVNNVYKRYSGLKKAGGRLEVLATGPRTAMHAAERRLTELMPGDLNKETWAGALQFLMRF